MRTGPKVVGDQQPNFGATAVEWSHFGKLACDHLLPVVSNPAAPLRPDKPLRALGKVPSIYNHNRQAVGLHQWTTREPSIALNIEAWAKELDYGISIRTGDVCAFDCDVPDVQLSHEITTAFEDGAGVARGSLPRRGRRAADGGTQGKTLIAFRVLWDGESQRTKRSFKVEALDGGKPWLVEFLAKGQQFIAAGTHPSGQRYEWEGGLPKAFPTLTAAQVNTGWEAVYRRFGIPESDARASGRSRPVGDDLDVDDPVAEHLLEHWEHYGIHGGKLYIACPWKADHSNPDQANESEAVWFLAGTRGERKGHFDCRHTGCQGRGDTRFFAAVGYKPVRAKDFEDLTQAEDAIELYERLAPSASPKSKELKAERKALADVRSLPLPGFNRDGQGRIECSLENLTRALNAPQAVGCWIAWDEFRAELVYAEREGEWQSMTDAFQVELAIRIERLGLKEQIGADKLRRALIHVGDANRMDSAIIWLTEVVPEWDGVPRIHMLWSRYIGTKDTPYTRALGSYCMTAQVDRILNPGCQVDYVPVLISPEGYRKTSVIAAIAPARELFSGFRLDKDFDGLSRQMRGKLVGELAELRGVSARDGESVKDFITKRDEEWTPKYLEHNVTFARRLVFYGTTNDYEFLKPHMGERRWLPVEVLREADIEAIEHDRLQLWAEAREVFLYDGGQQWQAVVGLADEERGPFREHHRWADRVNAALGEPRDIEGGPTLRETGVTTGEMLTGCVGIPAGRVSKRDEMDMGECLKACGMVRDRVWRDGKTHRLWVDARGGQDVVRKVDRRLKAGRS